LLSNGQCRHPGRGGQANRSADRSSDSARDPCQEPADGRDHDAGRRIYHSNAQALPGSYKNSAAATVRLEQTLKGEGVEPATGSELWQMRDESGTIELRLQYQRGVPTRSKPETKPRSAADPTIQRLYRFDQGVDVVRSIPAGIDRVQAYSLQVAVPELRPLFDGSDQLVSVSVVLAGGLATVNAPPSFLTGRQVTSGAPVALLSRCPFVESSIGAEATRCMDHCALIGMRHEPHR
jgi:hypothetical protein